jgi:demethylmenaquinone methyltransferase/2-methoxy-6-polyprenyl-1,4-benzoquinol methylase
VSIDNASDTASESASEPTGHHEPPPGLSKNPRRIAAMFDAIAARYDFLNHLLSAGIDRRWRARAVTALALAGGERVLDICTGTGDLAIAARLATPGAARVVGVDFSQAMLEMGARKLGDARLGRAVSLIRGDATRLPVADASVDAVTIAFGIRNVEDAAAACEEMRRVLRPGGRLAVLEFSIPTTPVLRQIYLTYFNHVLPKIGRMFSRHNAAYGYLPASVGAFSTPAEFTATLGSLGFETVRAVPLTFGIVFLYTASRPLLNASGGRH